MGERSEPPARIAREDPLKAKEDIDMKGPSPLAATTAFRKMNSQNLSYDEHHRHSYATLTRRGNANENSS
jgi:hypothetical protein